VEAAPKEFGAQPNLFRWSAEHYSSVFRFYFLVYNSLMLKIIGNDIWRGAEKIGYFRNDDIFNHEGKKLGYFRDNHVYDYNGKKLGYIQDDYLKTMDGKEVRLEDNRTRITSGSISDLERAAIFLLLGD
jgi:hypothetical protein